jgi:hypothetical protein
MQLGVLVDRLVDADKQTARVEPRQMLLEVERGPLSREPVHGAFFGRLVEHARKSRRAELLHGTICTDHEQSLLIRRGVAGATRSHGARFSS